jgi:VanZ like family
MRRLVAFGSSRWSAILWIGLILVATLVPFEPSDALPPIWCMLCGDGALADGILNVALFVPLGAALSTAGWRPVRALTLGSLLSFGVETTQFLIPGRDPSLSDVLMNTVGTLLGIALVRSARAWWRAKPLTADLLTIAVAIGTGLVFCLSGFLLRPSFPADTYYGGLMPRFGHLAWYSGHVLSASVGGLQIPSGVIANSAEVRQLLLSRATIDVRARAGPLPLGLAPLFVIDDGHQREILLLGIDGTDVVFRYRTHAIAARLHGPEIRVRGALRGIAPRDSFSVIVRQAAPGYCISVNATEHCGVGYTTGSGWALLLGDEPVSRWLQPVLNVAWTAVLFLPVGLLARFSWASTGTATSLLAALLILPPLIGLLPTPASEFLGAVVGLLSGVAVRAQ